MKKLSVLFGVNEYSKMECFENRKFHSENVQYKEVVLTISDKKKLVKGYA